jgi:tryptophan-rich sensory protein
MFTDNNVNTLVSWFITGVVMMFSGSYFMSKWKFRKYYHWLQLQVGGVFNFPRNGFGLMWLLIAGSQIAAMVLWTMNYMGCENTYYVVVVAMALLEFVFISMWAPLFVRMNRPGSAFFTSLIVLASAIVALVLMCVTVVRNDPPCIFGPGAIKTPGIVACALWGWPILWFLVVVVMTYRVYRSTFSDDPRDHLTYKHWVHHHLTPYMRGQRPHINYDSDEHRNAHKRRHRRQHRPRKGYDSYYGAAGVADAEIGAPLKQRSANLKPQ